MNDLNRFFFSKNVNSYRLSLFNISIEANIVDLDQTAPTGEIWFGSTLFAYESSNILVDDKKHIICDYAL